jgi:tetratricopeptide (TPR) repeat protein
MPDVFNSGKDPDQAGSATRAIGRTGFDTMGLHRWLLGLALGLTFAVYSGTLRYQFVLDDRGQILENPAVHSWHYVPQYFTQHVWAGVFPEVLGNYYRPLFLLWLRINDMLFGSRAWGWHLTSVFAHVGVTVLVYLLASQVLKDRAGAALAALVFGLHPIHIEAVAWVSGVTEPLLALLLIPAFLFHLKGREQTPSKRKWWALSLLFYALALLAKETALVLPLIIFVYEWVYGGSTDEPYSWSGRARRIGRAFRFAAPYFALIPPYLAARVFALKGFSHIATPLPFSTLLYTWPSLVWFWARHLTWPVGLSTLYDFPSVKSPDFWNFTLPAVGISVIGLILFLAAKQSRVVAFASAWLVLPLAPLLDLRVFVADDFAHDRYLYLPSVGFSVIAALVLRNLALGRIRLLGQSVTQIVTVLMVATLLAYGTLHQSFYFANEVAFYQYNYKSSPNSKLAMTNLASLLGEQGMYDDARALFQQVLERDPGFWPAAYNLGYTCYKMGRLREAEYFLSRAIQIDPAKPDEYLYLGMTRFRAGRLAEAEAALRRAIHIRPTGYGYHFALGVVLRQRGDFKGAVEQFKAELALNPQQDAARKQIAEIEQALKPERDGETPAN